MIILIIEKEPPTPYGPSINQLKENKLLLLVGTPSFIMKDASLPHPSSTLVHIGTLVAEVNSISDSAGYDQIPGHIPALLSCSSTTTSPHPAPVPFHCLLCACVIASDSASSELQRRLALAPHHNLQFARNMELFVCTTTSPGFCTLPPPGGGAYPVYNNIDVEHHTGNERDCDKARMQFRVKQHRQSASQ